MSTQELLTLILMLSPGLLLSIVILGAFAAGG